jgi:hypothetical protein
MLALWSLPLECWHAGIAGTRPASADRVPVQPQAVDFGELEGLPTPVQRYLRAVLEDKQPMVASVRMHHIRTFNTGEATDQWKPFTSDQFVVAQRPGFDWDVSR